MNCTEARTALEAEPGNSDTALLAHVEGCAACTAYRRELLELDDRLRTALAVAVPPARPLALEPIPVPVAAPARDSARVQRRAARVAGWALAASAAGVALLVGVLWTGFPRESLAADVVAHMAHEPAAWQASVRVATPRVARVLRDADVALRPGAVDVTYAQTCWFRGRPVPHLVVRTASGPVTVLVLAREPVAAREAFAQDGYHGELVPAPQGSLAVLARGDTDVAAAVARALAALEY